MKNILLIAPQPFYSDRGTPMNVRAFSQRLAEIGYSVDIVTVPFGRDISIPGVSIHRCLRLPFLRRYPIGVSFTKLVYDFVLLLSASRLLRQKKYFLIHGIEDGGILAGILSRLFRLPFLYDMDSCIVEGARGSFLRFLPGLLWFGSKLEARLIQKAAAIVTVAPSLTAKVKSVREHGPVFQIEDFPLRSANEVHSTVVARIRAEHPLKQKKVLLYTGNLEAYQGIDLLFESFSLLCNSAQSSSIKKPALLLVGGTPEAIAHYRRVAARLAISNDVIFAGCRPSEEMGSFLSLADVLLSPRIVGGNTPLKVFTYMLSGKPIVATDIESHRSVLSDENSFLAAPTPRAYMSALHLAIDDNAFSQRMRDEKSRRARELVVAEYSEDAFNRRVAALMEFLEVELSTLPSSREGNVTSHKNSGTHETSRTKAKASELR